MLKCGLYEIHWKSSHDGVSGGVSLAAIGSGPDGTRWLAPCNWVHPLVIREHSEVWEHWAAIDYLVLLRDIHHEAPEVPNQKIYITIQDVYSPHRIKKENRCDVCGSQLSK